MLDKKRGGYKNISQIRTKDNPMSTEQKCAQKKACSPPSLSAAQALVIGGILTGTLEIFSFGIDVNQQVEIALIGTLKTEKSDEKAELDAILEKLGSLPLDDVLKGIIERLSK